MTSRSLVVVGSGRAGSSFAGALANRGWSVATLGRSDALVGIAATADLVLLCVPDRSVSEVAASIEPGRAVVAHCAGSLGLDAISAGHGRRAAIHPLMSLPGGERGAELLLGAWFAVAGDAMAIEVVEALSGRWFLVDDRDRGAYHAAAAIASNHLVAILGQVERIAAPIGVPLEAYLDLAAASVENVRALGPSAALTGPAARGDWETIAGHRRALGPDELEGYGAGVDLARRLADQRESGG